jgi:hypothetical protein
MERISFAMFCGLLTMLIAGVAASPQANEQPEIPTHKLVGALRTLNTFEYSYRDEAGRFADREEMLAFLRKKDKLSKSPIDFENLKPYELAVTTSLDGMHYQITLKRTYDQNDKSSWCRTAAFSDDSGLIFLGSALDCGASAK